MRLSSSMISLRAVLMSIPPFGMSVMSCLPTDFLVSAVAGIWRDMIVLLR